MQQATRGLVDTLFRVIVVQVVVAVLAVGGLVVALGSQETSAARTASAPARIWKAEYSRAFPGCVATVLWPAGERPDGYVVQVGPGSVNRVSAAVYRDRAAAGLVPAGAEVLGVCR